MGSFQSLPRGWILCEQQRATWCKPQLGYTPKRQHRPSRGCRGAVQRGQEAAPGVLCSEPFLGWPRSSSRLWICKPRDLHRIPPRPEPLGSSVSGRGGGWCCAIPTARRFGKGQRVGSDGRMMCGAATLGPGFHPALPSLAGACLVGDHRAVEILARGTIQHFGKELSWPSPSQDTWGTHPISRHLETAAGSLDRAGATKLLQDLQDGCCRGSSKANPEPPRRPHRGRARQLVPVPGAASLEISLLETREVSALPPPPPRAAGRCCCQPNTCSSARLAAR